MIYYKNKKEDAANIFDGLPDDYFQNKNALNFCFFIQDDIVKADRVSPTVYESSLHERSIIDIYKDISDIALYIQVPWCEFRCTYCYYFKKLVEDNETIQHLIAAEQKHALLLENKINLKDKQVKSIYFGGGTPTILEDNLFREHIAFFVERYGMDSTEVCCEASLNTLTPKKLSILENYVTRISIGVQSFKDHLLKKVERNFTANQAIDMLQNIVSRFYSVNIDLIYGLQSQTMGDWMDSIEKAISLKVPSITAYRLELRHNVPMQHAFQKNPKVFPDELETQRMYLLAKERLLNAGYRENLIGWFLLPKVHDTVVYRERWEKQTPCVAIGPDVHNYGENHFYDNIAEDTAYIENINNNQLPIKHFYSMDVQEKVLWYIVSQWKSNSPVYKGHIVKRYGQNIFNWALELMKDYIEWNALHDEQDRIVLSDCGYAIIEWMLRDLRDKAFPQE